MKSKETKKTWHESFSRTATEISWQFIRSGFAIPLLLSMVIVASVGLCAWQLESPDLKELLIHLLDSPFTSYLGWILFSIAILVFPIALYIQKATLTARIRHLEKINEKALQSKPAQGELFDLESTDDTV